MSFDIREGDIVALLGRNGAGKTSTLRSIARLDEPELKHGEIWLDYKALHATKAHQATRNGVGLVPADRRIITGLTVEENLQLAQIAPPRAGRLHVSTTCFPGSATGSDMSSRRLDPGASHRGSLCALTRPMTFSLRDMAER